MSPSPSAFFAFESDFVETLRCIPMQVRFKLDTCGVKLKLPHWNQFNATERQHLVDAPCTTAAEIQAYRSLLHQFVLSHNDEPPADLSIDPAPDWHNATAIPESVQQKATELEVAIDLNQWAHLSPIQRFALIKLSRSSHENRNFLPALQEFHIV